MNVFPRSRLNLCCAMAISIGTASTAFAGGGTWVGGSDAWANDKPWSSGSVPTMQDTATFDKDSSYTVHIYYEDIFPTVQCANAIYQTAGTLSLGFHGGNLSFNDMFISGKVGAATGPTLKVSNGPSTNSTVSGYGDQYVGYKGGVGTIEISGGVGLGWAPWFTIGSGTASLQNIVYPGRGTAVVGGGAKFFTTFVYIGTNGGIGTTTIEGINTVVTSNFFEVGRQGEGTLILRNSARIQTYPMSGVLVGQNGRGFVSVANGATIAGDVLLSAATITAPSTAILNLNAGGMIDAANVRTYGSDDTQLNLNGGVLKTKSLNFQGDVSRFHWNSGTLHLNGGSILNMGSSSLQVNGKLMGTGTIVGSVSSSQEIAPGNSPGVLNINGDLVLNDGAKFSFELGSTSDQINLTGKLTDAGTQPFVFTFADAGGFALGSTYTLMNFGSSQNMSAADFSYVSSIPNFQGQFILNATSLQFAAVVPEPAALAAIGGVFGILLRRRQGTSVIH